MRRVLGLSQPGPVLFWVSYSQVPQGCQCHNRSSKSQQEVLWWQRTSVQWHNPCWPCPGPRWYIHRHIPEHNTRLLRHCRTMSRPKPCWSAPTAQQLCATRGGLISGLSFTKEPHIPCGPWPRPVLPAKLWSWASALIVNGTRATVPLPQDGRLEWRHGRRGYARSGQQWVSRWWFHGDLSHFGPAVAVTFSGPNQCAWGMQSGLRPSCDNSKDPHPM